MDKLYKTVLATVTVASVLVCSACAGAPAADQVQDPDAGKTLPEMTEKITISSGKISIPKRRSARYPGAGK